MANSFQDAFERMGGEVLLRKTVPVGERDFANLVNAFPKDFDMVFYGGAFEGAALLKAMRRAGLRQLFAAGDGCWDTVNFLEPAGYDAAAGEGILVLAATPAFGRVGGSEAFAKRYEQRFGPIINYAVNSYDSTRLLLQAIQEPRTKSRRFIVVERSSLQCARSGFVGSHIAGTPSGMRKEIMLPR
jgi:branched-chain amino acid transport system substrate-binding protein